MERRPATPKELKAMAHPLRLRIMRLCLDRSYTNKELAERLGESPATVLYHVRRLVEVEFLAAEDVRRGPRGALEKPYRNTGKTWTLSGDDRDPAALLPWLEAFRSELVEAGPGAILDSTRLGLRLSQEQVDELSDRMRGLLEEYLADQTPDGLPVGVFTAMHRRLE